MKKSHLLTVLTITSALFAFDAKAQVAGVTTSVGISLTESTQLALGWSVKKTLLGKTVYNEMGQPVGKVEDLIISPDRKVSYVIIGAGGFIGVGRHDVAIPVSQVQDQAGKLVMPGASKEIIKALPRFNYANDGAKREEFIASAETDITKAKAEIAALETRASTASTDTKATLDVHIKTLQINVKSAEAKLAEMKGTAAIRWKEFEASVSAAISRLRKSLDEQIA